MLFVPGTGSPKPSRRRWPRYLWLAPLGLSPLTISCGGGGGMGNSQPQPQQSGTPAGSYSVIVHANANSKLVNDVPDIERAVRGQEWNWL